MTTTTVETPTRPTAADQADELVRGFVAWASPPLSNMIALTERIASTLNTPVTASNGELDRELQSWQAANELGRAQMYPSLRAVASDKLHRERLSMDLAELALGAQRNLSRWVTKARREADEGRHFEPATDDPEELRSRADASSRAMSLSTMAPESLLKRAEAALADGDPLEADVLLRAVVIGGKARGNDAGSSYGVLRRRCDGALDGILPHRIEASRTVEAVTERFAEAVGQIEEFTAASLALRQADPTDPSEAVMVARSLVDRYAR